MKNIIKSHLAVYNALDKFCTEGFYIVWAMLNAAFALAMLVLWEPALLVIGLAIFAWGTKPIFLQVSKFVLWFDRMLGEVQKEIADEKEEG